MCYVLNVHIGTPVETEFSAHFVTDEKYDAFYLSALPIFKYSPHSSRVNVSLFKFFINSLFPSPFPFYFILSNMNFVSANARRLSNLVQSASF